MIFSTFKQGLFAITAVLSAMVSQPAQATIYDVTLGGTMNGVRFDSFGALPSVVRPFLFNGADVDATFQLDVTGNTINSITGIFELDGTSANILSIRNNSGGSSFRGFSMRFEDVGTGSTNVNDVRVDELAFRMEVTSGQTIEDAFQSAITDGSTFFRAAVTAAHRRTTNSVRFYRGFLDTDGTLSEQSVGLAATVPIPAGLLLLLTGIAGFGLLLRPSTVAA